MQCVRLLGRLSNIFMLREKTVLQMRMSTMSGSRNRDGVPYSAEGDRGLEEKLLLPLTHLSQLTGRDFQSRWTHAFNYWLKVPADKLIILEDVFQILHNCSILLDDIQDNSNLRGGIPVAHSLYGIPWTINAVFYAHFTALKKLQNLNYPKAMAACTEQLLELYRGQGMDIYWRDNNVCPSVEEYQEMVKRKVSGLVTLPVQLMQVFSENKSDFIKLTNILGQYFQIRDDYCNLCLQQYSDSRGYCEDLTEGKFSFPIIHAIKSNPDDKQVMNILQQRTRDLEVKKYCVALLEKFGSFSYTRRTLEELDAEAKAEVAKHGGNPQLEDLLDEMLNWKRETNEISPEQ